MKGRKIVFSLAVACLLFLFSGSLHAAEGLIEKVEFHKENGRMESVIFHLNGPFLPKVFALKGDNPRVVFDFLETRLARSVSSSIDAKGIMIRKIRMGRHGTKTRVVIDLAAGGEFNFDQKFDENSNILTIKLFPADFPENKNDEVGVEQVLVPKPAEEGVPEPVEGVVPETAEEIVPEPDEEAMATEHVAPVMIPEPEQEPVDTVEKVESVPPPVVADVPVPDPLLFDVTFENTSNKGEMVIFKLNGFYPPTVSGKEEGTPLVICDFAGTRLGETVVKDQEFHGEYVKRVRVQQLDGADMVRVTLELVPGINYDLQQVFFKEDNLFVIIVNSYESLDKTK